MKSGTALFLQVVVVLFGLAVLAFLLGEPHLEGRNANATLFEVYFKDPFLAYVYVGSVPIFVAVYKAFGLFGKVRRTGRFSQSTVEALRSIKRCAATFIGFVVGGVIIILLTGDPDDRPAGIFMSLLVTVSAGTVAGMAALFERNVLRVMKRTEGV